MGIKQSLQSMLAIAKASVGGGVAELKSSEDPLPQYANDSDLDARTLVTLSGLTARVNPFTVGSFHFPGGTIPVIATGTWFVGVELSSKQLRTLPRLGHRGWIPVARVVTNASAVVSFTQIAPVLPACRIPRTYTKILTGQPVNVVVMGSSLTSSGGGATDWPGMVFGAGTALAYRLPTTVSTQYSGLGASPNAYQLAQLGNAFGHTGSHISNSGGANLLAGANPPTGRSRLFNGVDLVVIGCLANGGEYRLEMIEPLLRNLKKRGVEVVVTTDNPQNPSTDYITMDSSLLYSDGPYLQRLVELYGFELADTAAYVFEAHLRSGGVGIYGDSIHMANGVPTGPNALMPANGHECWARAVRSAIGVGAVDPSAGGELNGNISFDQAGTTNWTAHGTNTVQNLGGLMRMTFPVVAQAVTYAIPNQAAGTQLVVTADIAANNVNLQFGVTKNGVWDGGAMLSNITTTGVKVLTATLSGGTDYKVHFWSQNSTTGVVDLNSLSVTSAPAIAGRDHAPGRAVEITQLPPSRLVTDYKTPGDAFVILPKDERNVALNQPARGTLSQHPYGSASFARRFMGSAATNLDMLTLTVGQTATIAGDCLLALAIIHYREVADGACTFNVKCNSVVAKSVTISTPPFSNDWLTHIYSPSQLNANTPLGQDTITGIDIEVTSGTLKICALVAYTPEMEYLAPEEITYVGPGWLPKENSRSGLPGRPTDTMNDYAMVNITGNRLGWILSANPGSMPVHYKSTQDASLNSGVSGAYHIRTLGGLAGKGRHVVQCTITNATGSQANGRALHVGGAIVVYDR